MTYDEIWRTDDKMRAPEGWATTDNPHWWPESVLEHMGDVISTIETVIWKYRGFDYVNTDPEDTPTTKDHQVARAHEYSFRAASASEAVQADLSNIHSKLDSLTTGLSDAHVKLDAIKTTLDQHAAGTLDAQEVVDGIRDLFNEITAPETAPS